jgi:GT2 family glycosyltransferase
MDHLHRDTLRLHLLNAPTDGQAWAQLARELTLKGDAEAAMFAAQFAPPAATRPTPEAPEPDAPEPEAPGAEAADASPALLIQHEGELSLELVAQRASAVLAETGQPFLVLSVAAGTITIAATQSSAQNGRLFCGSQQSHVQTGERLLYRDPATGLRIACLTLQPIRLAELQPRSLDAYAFDYANWRCPLVEAMPGLRVPLQVQLEGWDGMRVRGWMSFDGDDLISRVPCVVVLVDGTPVQLLEPSQLRLDVIEALQKPHRVSAGFELNGVRKLVRRESSELQFRDPFTFELLGAFILNRFRTFHQQIQQVSKGFCGFDFQDRDGEVVVTSLPRHRDQQPVAVVSGHKLDILVPVYKNWPLTRDCLTSLRAAVDLALAARPGREIYVHATNDCSPDEQVNENLAALCDQLGIIYHVNEENLGFIRTVNNIMNATAADVLLVNSDVIVSVRCIAELITAREALGAHVASLTAFSNNATIFSYPRQIVENPVSSPAAIERIAEAFRAATPEGEPTTHQVPVSHGFLMYLSRTALDAVGVFDEYFGKGYGEEVDWAVRAALKGFEHHICTTAYAFHKGSVSFGADTRLQVVQNSNRIVRERYPFYDKMVEEFIYVDEFCPLRNQVALSLLLSAGRPLALHVTHSSGGGVDKYIEGLRQEDPNTCHVLLRPGRSYADLVTGSAATKLFAFSLECDELDAVILGDFKGVVCSSIAALRELITTVTLHSFVGWKAEEIELLMATIQGHGMPYAMVAHDYMPVCPRIKLIDSSGDFCDVGDTARCTHCLRTGETPVESALLAPFTSDITLYRSLFTGILEGAVEIICSTADQAQRFARQGFENTVVREPHEPASSLLPGYRHDPASRNIVLIGGLSVEKGAERLFQVASHSLHINPSSHFYLVGAACNVESLATLPNFTHIGGFTSFNQLHDHLRSIHSPIAFFPAIWPETWCYTLSEALLMGLPVIAPNLGALGSRLQELQSPLVTLYPPTLSHLELAELVCAGLGRD